MQAELTTVGQTADGKSNIPSKPRGSLIKEGRKEGRFRIYIYRRAVLPV